MAAFAILRTKKHKHFASILGVARHHAREVPCPTADPAKAKGNKSWGAALSPSQAVALRVGQVIEEAQKKAPKKFRSDSVKAIEYLMTASPEWWATADKKAKNGYLNKCREWLQEKHGAGCVVAEWLHVDERSPHLHAIVVPLHEGKLNAKHFLGGKSRMRDLQTDFAERVGVPFGLMRGIEGSNVEHVNAADWWSALEAPRPTPRKSDHLKAAVGLPAPVLDTTAKQSAAFEASIYQRTALKKRAEALDKKAAELDERERKLVAREEVVKQEGYKIEDLERANKKLKERVQFLEGPRPAPAGSGAWVDALIRPE